ncbi:hypothetical protein [Rickettsia endosymbiont of Ceutorhynchus obstrictus]
MFGGIFVLAIISFANYFLPDWCVIFLLGAMIAFIGRPARIKLREIRNVLNMVSKQRLEITEIEKKVKQYDNSQAVHNLLKNNIVNKKTSIAYFLIEWATPLWFYIIYIYSGNILKNLFSYTFKRIIFHNLIISIIEFLGVVIITCLANRIKPLRLLQIKLIIFSIFIPIFCVGSNYISTPYELAVFQIFICLLAPTSFPAFAIFYGSFSVFQRYKQINLIFNLARTLMYIIAFFGSIIATNYWSSLGLLLIIFPVLLGYKYGLYYFKRLEITNNNI